MTRIMQTSSENFSAAMYLSDTALEADGIRDCLVTNPWIF